jgi:hypothetical protein
LVIISLPETVDCQVAAWYIRDFSLFSVRLSSKNCPSVGCYPSAIVVCNLELVGMIAFIIFVLLFKLYKLLCFVFCLFVFGLFVFGLAFLPSLVLTL